MAESGERTDAEREAARLERERRRAQQQEDEALFGTEGRNGDVQGEVAELEGDAEKHEVESGHVEDELKSDEHELDDDEGPEELPSGTRRVAHRDRPSVAPPVGKRSRDREPRRRRRTGPVQRRRRPSADRRRHSWAGRLLSVLAIAATLAAIWFLFELFQPFQRSGHGRVTVTIPPHASAGTIGKLLERDGVISSSFFFELRAILAGERGDLRSGTYHLTRGMSYGDVLKILTTAPPAARVTNLTIVEGKTRRQVDSLLRSQGVHGSYLGATRHSKLLDPRRYGAPRHTGSLEGFLFPATYQLRDPISVSALVADQLQTFRQRFAKVNLGYARHKHLSSYDVLIIASMVQAEAETDHDRPLIASVIYNRLARGMPLQIDATTRYATGNYTKPLTDSQLNSRSPYNTRIHTGLPPGAINSPGLSSIEAAAHPAKTTYLYFVVKPCGNGEHAFASTYSRFQAEVRRYQAARSSRGGRSPAHC